MGEVYEAEQERPLRRRVAVKVIKPGMDSKEVLARFESERQALALMDHPNIAQVYDAGATTEGRPYFAMEYVAGVPVNVYCDEQRLSVNDRLQLFIQVCHGVQHAHQKGVIHRDLKPSNVLVTVQDDHPTPKIIDFGVAKAISQRLTERTVFTALGQWIGTPEYMSPEQAGMTGLDIDTRTDVYSLGVLLYELLVGALPFESRELREAGFDEMRRMIREEDPTRPSTKLGDSDDASGLAARNRRTDLPVLRKLLRGDLDWITMKALEKDRTRRYGSPAELAADLERHLRHEPVLAGPPSTLYRAGKFVRRHRMGVVAGSLVFLALLAGITGTSIGLLRARQEAQSAQQVAEFLADMLQDLNPEVMRGQAATPQEILDRAVARIETELAEQPLVQARLFMTVGASYEGFGLYETARRMFEKSAALRREQLGEDDLDYALSISFLGDLLRDLGDYETARQLHEEALAIRTAKLGPDHKTVGWSLRSLGNVHWHLADYEEARSLLERSLRTLEAVYGPDHYDISSTLHSQALLEMNTGNFAASRELFERCLGIREAALGPSHPEVAVILRDYALLLAQSGDLEGAESLATRALEIFEQTLGPSHVAVAQTLGIRGAVFQNRGQLDAARRDLERGLAIARLTVPEKRSRAGAAAARRGPGAGLGRAGVPYRTRFQRPAQ
jgi:non-specific serine/threonine protein kinase/serine/threonine-protein kinase